MTPEDSLRLDDVKNMSLIPPFDTVNMEKLGNLPSIQTTQPTPPMSSPSSLASPTSLCANNPDAQLETDMSDTTESEADKVPGMKFHGLF